MVNGKPLIWHTNGSYGIWYQQNISLYITKFSYRNIRSALQLIHSRHFLFSCRLLVTWKNSRFPLRFPLRASSPRRAIDPCQWPGHGHPAGGSSLCHWRWHWRGALEWAVPPGQKGPNGRYPYILKNVLDLIWQMPFWHSLRYNTICNINL